MDERRTCTSCGAEIDARAVQRLCQACLLKAEMVTEKQADSAETSQQSGLQPGGPPFEKPGDKIGHFKLLQQIGEGGCGLVYMAEQQEPVKRRVALKIIKPGMDTRQVLARFEAERQALALMDHPNIAKVLDAGATENGRPFFVMELVRGVRITEFCDDPQNNLSTEQRLNLFIEVCSAIQHAHQKGIIHRDIKPSNILVTLQEDGKPAPKVIDFGIAKATAGQTLTDKTLFTAFEQFIGTPAYMSPEQAQLTAVDIDTRSDIYSLGVLLYELLTGQTPFDAKRLLQAGFDEIRRIIVQEEPPRPSTRLSSLSGEEKTTVARRRQSDAPKLIHQFRGDLDWIAMKCLDKNRTRRYETASGLAADIRRYLNQEPVLAGPPTASYRLGKFVRKHRAAVATAAGCVLLLAAATTVSGLLAVRASQKAKAETKAKAEAQAVLTFFQEKVLAAARPEGQDGGLGRDVTLRAALAAGEPSIAPGFSNQPLAEASIRDVLGGTYRYLGDYTNAVRQYERALTLRKANLGLDHSDTMVSMHNLAAAYGYAGRLSNSVELNEQTLKLKKAKLGPDDPHTLDSMNGLAIAYRAVDRTDEALALDEETLKLRRSRFGPDHPKTLESMSNLAIAYAAAGRTNEALDLFKRSLELRKGKLGPDHPDTFNSMNNLGLFYCQVGMTNEGLQLCKEVVKLRRIKLGDDHPDTIGSIGNLAIAYLSTGQISEALPLYEENLKLSTAKLGTNHHYTLTAMNNLADAYSQAGQLEKAIVLHDQALRLMRVKLGPAHSLTVNSMNSLAEILATCNDPQIRDGARAVSLAEEAVAATQRKDGDLLDTLAAAYAETGRFAKAISTEKEAMALIKDPSNRKELEDRLKLYEANAPYRQPSR